MKLFDFKLLSTEEQVALVYEQGVYIGKRKQADQFILLYQLESFYVELYYWKYRHSISAIKSSALTNILEPYLEQIEVENLV